MDDNKLSFSVDKDLITFACFKVDAVCFHTQRLVC